MLVGYLQVKLRVSCDVRGRVHARENANINNRFRVSVCLHGCECVCQICMCVFVKTVSIAIGMPVLPGKQ